MIDIKVTKTFKGLTVEFKKLSSKPLFQELNTGFLLLQLEDPIYKKSDKKIRDLIPLHYTFLNNHYNLNPQQVAELEDWFNQPAEELLKYLGDDYFDFINESG
ncbi:hypothetical protein [Methanobacterium sp. SMA-27]|uniref:hypothetical protein n=1 Tax=Methanobacterium sp. SMA-27 TaxID=1495336 RepID=UPI00064F9C8E|nr:hypothetical protein [Methanobacterium sp. SMA-27]